MSVVIDGTSITGVEYIKNSANETKYTLNDQGQSLPDTPVFQAYGIGGGTYASGNYMIFPSTLVNDGNGYNPSNGRFTAPVNGIYTFHWACIGDDQPKWYALEARLNGTYDLTGRRMLRLDARRDADEGLGYPENGAQRITIGMEAGDYFQIYFFSESGTSLYPGGNSASNHYLTFSGYMVGTYGF